METMQSVFATQHVTGILQTPHTSEYTRLTCASTGNWCVVKKQWQTYLYQLVGQVLHISLAGHLQPCRSSQAEGRVLYSSNMPVRRKKSTNSSHSRVPLPSVSNSFKIALIRSVCSL
mmetsp:Transcript_8425/g.23435  ORF Transcript_8425/g.23435 Transcript_8425/m.23435 type:complete len:117 (-) Transcript_8425:76-426(-)